MHIIVDVHRSVAYSITKTVSSFVSAQVHKCLKFCYSSIYPKTGYATYSVATGSPSTHVSDETQPYSVSNRVLVKNIELGSSKKFRLIASRALI